MTKNLKVVAGFAVCAFTVAVVVGAETTKTKAPAKPTGACTITVYGITPTCTSPMTLNSCNTTAKKVGGVASWQEGKACARK